MIPKTLRSFILRLRKSTDEGDLRWSEGASDAYYCNHKAYELHLRYNFDPNSGIQEFYFLMKSKGKNASFSVNDTEDDFGDMKDLYASVTILAAGFDNIEEDFFSDGA